jgi:hypothetical protein
VAILLLLTGSGLTILGGFLANRQNYKLSQSAEATRTKREKLEQLATLSVSIGDWIEEMEDDTFAIPPRHTKSDPTDRMYMLSALYFPDMYLEIHEVCDSARQVCQCIRREAQRRFKDPTPIEAYATEYLALHETFLEKRQALMNALEALAKHINV